MAIAIRNARSSTHSAMCGKTLLTQRPHWPCCLNANGDFMTSPGALVAAALSAEVDLLAVPLVELGLVVERVHLADAAVHEQLNDAAGPWPGGAGRR